ncbi:hypothetical protein ATK36_4028 [Amycolatopsis sulphurea]|uniref:Uncharacterized protein n=1 Tax=Amycolatopsis sulphurea TaxID=76022 RepID=A0A2A9FEI1_9PSEU|nr:hypothetical protein [Amycolatopsis sulphurea]PFG48910.1 hypothetical protein ATK36_4028 [Amycolatopsis sulphurea]
MDVLREKGLAPLRVILAFSVLSTGFHYWHMVARPRAYPSIPGLDETVGQVGVGVAWVVFTVVAVLGYRAYLQERYRRALVLLLVYSLSGLVTAGHFLIGFPDLPRVWLIPLVGDTVAAVALWAFVSWAWAALNRVRVSTQH